MIKSFARSESRTFSPSTPHDYAKKKVQTKFLKIEICITMV